MGLHFGQLYKGMRGIVMYKVSPFELKAFAGMGHGFSNAFRRFRESVFYVAGPFIGGYLVFDYCEKKHARLQRKNPEDYVNDK